jgi:hypothetical protein
LKKLNDVRQRLNGFLNDIEPWKKFIPSQWFDEINRKLSDYDDNELKLKHGLSDLLFEIRKGKAEESKILRLKNDFNEQLRSFIPIEIFFNENQRIKTKIKTLSRVSPKRKELLTHIKSTEDFLQDFYDNDVYFLHICEQWQKDDEENSFKQMKYFINLKKIEEDSQNNKVKFWVIDHDLHSDLKDKPKKSVIYYATNASVISRDFYDYSLSKFIIVAMKL